MKKTNFLKAEIKDVKIFPLKFSFLKTLSKYKDLIIQKSEEGHSQVLINKSD